MITIDFEYKLDVDYSFQHRYRSKAINFYFMKEMLFGLTTCMVILVIYFDYLDRFRGNDIYMESHLAANGTVVTSICMDEDECYGVGNYDFSELKPRKQYLTTEERLESSKVNLEAFKEWTLL